MTTRAFFTFGTVQIRLEASNAGVGFARRKVGEVDGDQAFSRWQRRAVGLRDHDTLASYRAAVRDLLVAAGLTEQEATDSYWQRITQGQWNNR